MEGWSLGFGLDLDMDEFGLEIPLCTALRFFSWIWYWMQIGLDVK